MKLEELHIYQSAIKIGERVWNIVDGWEYFSKRSLGLQLVKAADSIAANISEGYGRYHFKESKNFAYYARGSLFEQSEQMTTELSSIINENLNYHNFHIHVS